ncbi:unnamed protein product [Macrosiphum euphorbiae]|uniref:Uncharacterized protein n=1 Tax=Macrosiphum euphorbiae TaxID=13131 RepID=A0AAV0XT74_9HEMI|nr:unnamed protein product [Macrosiphum euphorbiae]
MDHSTSHSIAVGHGSSAQQEASQAPVAQPNTSTETTHTAIRALGKTLQSQESRFKLLLSKASHVELLTEKLRSESAKKAIKELLEIIEGMKSSREGVTMAFNQVVAHVRSDIKTTIVAAKPPKLKDSETQSPCWWDIEPPTSTQHTTEAEGDGAAPPPMDRSRQEEGKGCKTTAA